MADETVARKGQGVTRAQLAANRANGLKRCFRCEAVRPFNEFALDASRPDGLQPRCRGCTSEARRQWATKEAERAATTASVHLPRTCIRCGEDKSAAEFREYRIPKLHRSATCLACDEAIEAERLKAERSRKRTWARQNLDKVLATGYAWAAKNPDRIKAKAIRWRARHYDAIRAKEIARCLKNIAQIRSRQRELYALNHERHLLKHRRFYVANRDKELARHAAYRRANPEIRRAHDTNRSARERQAEGRHTAADVRRLLTLQSSKCAHSWCRKNIKAGFHVDHVMPLARGGSNDWRNLQLLCQNCNQRKHAKHPVDFARENGLLL